MPGVLLHDITGITATVSMLPTCADVPIGPMLCHGWQPHDVFCEGCVLNLAYLGNTGEALGVCMNLSSAHGVSSGLGRVVGHRVP
jgi:hypothetical protein